MNQSTLPGPIPAPRIVQAPRGSSHQIPPPLRDTQPSSTQPPRRQNLLPQRFTFCAADVRARPVDVRARPVRAMASPRAALPPGTLSRAPTRLDRFPTLAMAAAAGGPRERTAISAGSGGSGGNGRSAGRKLGCASTVQQRSAGWTGRLTWQWAPSLCLCCHLGACRVRAWSSSSVSVVAAHGSGRTRGNIQRNNSGRTVWSTREPLELLLPPTSEQRAGSSSLQFLLGAPVENIARRAVLGLRHGRGGGGGSSERHRTARRWRWRGLRAEAPWTEPRQLPDGSARLSPICVDSYRKGGPSCMDVR